MSWERRRNGRYYYQARREGDRVVKRYLGRGAAAQAAAAEVDARRRQRLQRREAQWQAKADRAAVTQAWEQYLAASHELIGRLLA